MGGPSTGGQQHLRVTFTRPLGLSLNDTQPTSCHQAGTSLLARYANDAREARHRDEDPHATRREGSSQLAAVLTHGLQVDVDKVEAVVLQGVMRLGRDVQVAVALLVAQVHLDP